MNAVFNKVAVFKLLIQQDQEKWTCRMLTLHQAQGPPLTHSVRSTPRFSPKGNEDIGQTQLVTMDIDMGDSPLVSSRLYTLALKHHRWVQEEIETLERAGVITKSMSPWASPIVIVPKKSQPGEPPKKRLCINFRKINDLQQKVITEGKSKGCLSLIPDLGWNADQQGTNRQPLPKEKQPEVTVTQTTPIEVEGPPSSRL